MTTEVKKIIIFIHDLRDGGAQRSFVNLANALCKYDIEVHLVVLDEGLLKSVLDEKIIFHKIESKRVLFSFKNFHSVVKKIKPDVILTGLLQNNIFVCLYSLLYSFKGKVVVSEHSIPSHVNLSNESMLIKISSRARCYIYKFSDLVVAVSTYCKEDLVVNFSIPSNKIKVINNPVVNDDFTFGFEKINKNEPYVFCSIGRLHPVKNHTLLLESLSVLKDITSIKFKLLILGDGPEKENIKEKILSLGLDNCVELMGFISNPYCVIRNSDLVIVSSRIEGFCNVVVESLACGVPVVSTKCFGPEEIIDSEEYGILCEHDAHSMAQAIQKSCVKKYEHSKLIDKSKIYSSSVIAGKYLEALKCLV